MKSLYFALLAFSFVCFDLANASGFVCEGSGPDRHSTRVEFEMNADGSAKVFTSRKRNYLDVNVNHQASASNLENCQYSDAGDFLISRACETPYDQYKRHKSFSTDLETTQFKDVDGKLIEYKKLRTRVICSVNVDTPTDQIEECDIELLFPIEQCRKI